jgi:hypothetical protein
MHVDIAVRHELFAAHDVRNVLVLGEDFNGIPERLQAFAMQSFLLWLGICGLAARLERCES